MEFKFLFFVCLHLCYVLVVVRRYAQRQAYSYAATHKNWKIILTQDFTYDTRKIKKRKRNLFLFATEVAKQQQPKQYV